jgi:chromosome segregation ATPase
MTTTTNARSELDRIVRELGTQRDELRLKLHLAKADAKDEWERLEKKWEHLRGKLDVVGREAKDAGKDVLAATRLVAREIKEGYDRVRALL